jgi:membrane protease YdiL (CAAX protease family)
MTGERTPWNPDKAWADPLIALLALLCLLASGLALRLRSQAVPRPPSQVGLQGRVVDLTLGAQVTLGTPVRKLPTPDSLPNPWDRAVAAVLLAESKALEPAKAMANQAPQLPGFQSAFTAAYLEGRSAPLDPQVKRGLGPTLAAGLLEARLAPEASRAQARKVALEGAQTRLAAFAGLGLLLLLLGVGGLIYGIWLATAWPKAGPGGARFPLPGRAVALVLLGWFVGFFALNTLVLNVLTTPGLRPWALPLGYLLQAGWGGFLILRATGQSLSGLRAHLFPGRWRDLLPHALGGWGLALVAVLMVGLLLGPFLKGKASPQEELIEGLRVAQGPVVIAMFLTVAVLAPCFEELMMRGFLLGHLRTRWATLPALVATSLLFGFIHLQPLALPTLSTLGAVLGLLVLRTGDLRSSILLHGIWNGSVFLLVRALG